jgi:hypothetical protein
VDHSHGGLAAKDPTVPERPGDLGAELRPASVPTRVPTDSIASVVGIATVGIPTCFQDSYVSYVNGLTALT